MNPEVRQLIRKLKDAGYDVAKTGSNHYKVLQKDSVSVVLDPLNNVPIVFAATPSDWRWRSNAVSTLMRAGVFESDPFGATTNGSEPKEKKTPHSARKREREARALEAKQRDDNVRVRNKHLAARIEGIAEHFGGWRAKNSNSGLAVNEFLRATKFAAPTLWPKDTIGRDVAEHSAETTLRNLRSGTGVMGLKWLPVFEAFVHQLYGGRDDSETAAIAYTRVVEQMNKPDFEAFRKVIMEEPLIAVALDSVEDETTEPAEPVLKPMKRSSEHSAPASLKDQVFWFMARGAEPSDREEVLRLARLVGALEKGE